jgi:nitrogen fixation NifU-like protein
MSSEKIQGGAMGGVEDLYREVILDHFKAPKNRGALDNANAKADGMNPLCGDQLSMTARVENGTLTDVRFDGHGCAISQSAASMLTALMKGRSIDEIAGINAAYKHLLGVEGAQRPAGVSADDLGDLVALEGVKKYPVRIKCALLSVNTLMEALASFQNIKGQKP